MKLIHTIRAEAHCDIPCGIYDPTPAKIAAKTVARMVEQLDTLPLPGDENDMLAINAYHNALMRRIMIKEQHAELVKRELEILWSDFFKPEHLEKYPNLHELFWKTIKLASKLKQDPHTEDAVALLAGVDEIARIFYETKGAPEKYEAYKTITDTLY
ncbi:MAG: superoxide dismutase, Ni [bacterium]|nr:superoxide dismutase, Ni [bacterium]MDZ4284983.1 superoxide dismutase, Ni [Patescibacteria group bacterium]